MKALLAVAAVVVGIAAPSALAAKAPGSSFYAEHSASQNRIDRLNAVPGYGFITENSMTQNRIDRLNAAPGYRFITENSMSQNRLNPSTTSVGSAGFRWGDAGIGASAMFGVVLLTLGGALLALRRRAHVATAS
jgi:hypothetical protein